MPVPRSRPHRLRTGAALLAALIGGLLCAALAGGGLLAGTTATAATATSAAAGSDGARLALSATAPVTFTAVAPGKLAKRVVTLPAGALTTTGDAVVPLSGALRVRRGKWSVTFGGLQLELGPVSASVTAKDGKGRRTVLTVKPRKGSPLEIDARAGSVRLVQASVTLAPAGASAIRRALRLRRAPSSKTAVGAFTLIVEGQGVTTTPTSGPGTPGSTTTQPATTPTQPPETTPTTPANTTPTGPSRCWSAATPAGSTDWIACDVAGSDDIKSWTNYILSGGSIATTNGASHLGTANYDYRLTVASTVTNGDGRVTISHTGKINYLYPGHGIDLYVEQFVITVAANRASATVDVVSQFAPRDNPSDVQVRTVRGAMTIDLTAATTTQTSGGITSYTHAPATLTENGRDIWGPTYPVGAAWGAFNLRVPTA